MGLQIFLILASYFLGAIPFGLLIAKTFYGMDIRQHGSKNVGATNVLRTLGKKPGLITLFLDALKGFIPVLASNLLYPEDIPMAIGCGVATIIGHNWSVFLKGKGGKGVATSGGVFLALIPKHMGLSLLPFAILFGLTRTVSIGSLTAALVLVLSTFFLQTHHIIQIVVSLAALMIFIKHIPNVRRILKGEEPKVKF